MISTQPGSMPLASFKVVAIENLEPIVSYNAGNDFGLYEIFHYIRQIYLFFSCNGMRMVYM